MADDATHIDQKILNKFHDALLNGDVDMLWHMVEIKEIPTTNGKIDENWLATASKHYDISEVLTKNNDSDYDTHEAIRYMQEISPDPVKFANANFLAYVRHGKPDSLLRSFYEAQSAANGDFSKLPSMEHILTAALESKNSAEVVDYVERKKIDFIANTEAIDIPTGRFFANEAKNKEFALKALHTDHETAKYFNVEKILTKNEIITEVLKHGTPETLREYTKARPSDSSSAYNAPEDAIDSSLLTGHEMLGIAASAGRVDHMIELIKADPPMVKALNMSFGSEVPGINDEKSPKLKLIDALNKDPSIQDALDKDKVLKERLQPLYDAIDEARGLLGEYYKVAQSGAYHSFPVAETDGVLPIKHNAPMLSSASRARLGPSNSKA